MPVTELVTLPLLNVHGCDIVSFYTDKLDNGINTQMRIHGLEVMW